MNFQRLKCVFHNKNAWSYFTSIKVKNSNDAQYNLSNYALFNVTCANNLSVFANKIEECAAAAIFGTKLRWSW